MFLGGCYAGLTAALSSTTFNNVGGINSWVTTEAQRQNIIARQGTFKWAYIATSSAQPASGAIVFTLRVNGADTSIVITIALSSAAGTFTDLANTATISAGDLVCWKAVNSATAASAIFIGSGIYFYGNDAKYSRSKTVIGGLYNNLTIAQGTFFSYIYGPSVDATENKRQCVIPVPGTITGGYLVTSTTQSNGVMTWTLRINGVDKALVITVANGSAAGTFTDLVNTVGVVAGDLVCWKVVQSSGASASIIGFGFYHYN